MDQQLHTENKITILADLLHRNPGFAVLTGAGCSTESGLPAYRDQDGEWKHSKPMQHQDFMTFESKRKFYWARSMLAWPNFKKAKPSQAHIALNELASQGVVSQIITQNVDRLHQTAGSQDTLDIHGRLDQVICMNCSKTTSRESLQLKLESLNPDFHTSKKSLRPDGDIDIETDLLDSFKLPACEQCNGILKPNVVFFGDVLDPKIVEQASKAVNKSSGLLVVGSSLMVYSGLRYVKQATEQSKPVVIINRGLTRADNLCLLKINQEAGSVLAELNDLLA